MRWCKYEQLIDPRNEHLDSKITGCRWEARGARSSLSLHWQLASSPALIPFVLSTHCSARQSRRSLRGRVRSARARLVIAAGTTSSMAFNYLANPRPEAASRPRSRAIQLSCSPEPFDVVYISLKPAISPPGAHWPTSNPSKNFQLQRYFQLWHPRNPAKIFFIIASNSPLHFYFPRVSHSFLASRLKAQNLLSREETPNWPLKMWRLTIYWNIVRDSMFVSCV